MAGEGQIRWELAGDEQDRLFGLTEREVGLGEFRGMEFLRVRAKSLINEVPAAARVPFRYTVNVYRGCSHACVYCFARPTHEYLGLGAGEDFERKIVVKINAVDLLRAETEPGRWAGEHIAMGTNTDPYQRCEGKYRLTRGVVEVLTERANPFSILTKNTLVIRDLDLLAEAVRRADVAVNLSIGTLDEEVWRATEPNTPHPKRRMEAVARLNEAGVPCGVLIAPVIPGMSDAPEQLEAVAEAALEAGARNVYPIVLHLRPGVKEQFMPWLGRERPDLVPLYRRLYPRSYAPRKVRGEVAGRVRVAIRRRGGPVSRPDSRGIEAEQPDPAPEPRQLDLGV